jgi:anti-sigma regulatory factor (Ser/Thr protein kinase)
MQADVLALDLPMSPAAPGLARRAVDELDLAAGQRESARLLASELVTNAVCHCRGPRTGLIRIRAAITGRTLRLSVTDPGTDGSRIAPRAEPGVDGGFGLLLVRELAARWGVERDGATTVWCELALDGLTA